MADKLSDKQKALIQDAQDVLSSLAMLPVKIYDEDANPVTRWSNPTFLHWLTDYHEFEYCDEACRERATDFNNLANLLSDMIKDSVKETIKNLQRSLSSGEKEQDDELPITFRLIRDKNIGPQFKLIPIKLFGQRLYALIGGIWILEPKKDKIKVKNKFVDEIRKSYGKDLSFTEFKLILNEAQDLPVMYIDNFNRQAVRLLRALRSIHYFEDKPLESIRKTLIGSYRISEFRDEWNKYIRGIFDISEEIERVLVAMPSPPGYDDLIYGYLWVFDRENTEKVEDELIDCLIRKHPASDLYMFDEKRDKEAFLTGNLDGIRKVVKKVEIRHKEISLDKNPFYPISDTFFQPCVPKFLSPERNAPRIVFYVRLRDCSRKFRKKVEEKIEDGLKNILPIMQRVLNGIFQRTPGRELMAKEFALNSSLELLSDFSSYFKHSNERFIGDLMRAMVKTFPGITEIEYLRPQFFQMDKQFEVYYKAPRTGYNEEKETTKIPDEVWDSFFTEMEFQSVEVEGYLYEPVLSEHRVLSVLKIKPEKKAWIPELNYRMSQKLVSILTYRVPYRRFVKIVETMRKELANANIDRQIKELNNRALNELAREIAMGFTAHACTIWVYDKYENKFYRKGFAGELNELLKNDELPLDPSRNMVSISWRKSGKIISVKEKDFSMLAFGNTIKKLGFNKGLAVSWRSSPDFGIVVTLWSKLKDAWELSNEDKERLLEITHFVSDSLKVKYDLYLINRETDEAITSILHEIKSPFSGIKSGIEYIADLIEETLKPSIEVVENNEPEFHTVSDWQGYAETTAYSLDKFRDALKNKEFVKLLFENLKEADELINKNIYPPMHYFNEIVKFVSFYIRFKSGQIDFSKGEPQRIKFWSTLVNELVKRTLYFYMDAKGLKLVFEFDKDRFPKHLHLTEPALDALKVIMFNLISNAIKYSDRGTTIILQGNTDDKFVRIQIHNHGIGIPEGEEELIFQQWRRGSNASQASPEGTGLGLYLSRELIRALGGDLVLKRNANPTIFELKIPRKYFTDF